MTTLATPAHNPGAYPNPLLPESASRSPESSAVWREQQVLLKDLPPCPFSCRGQDARSHVRADPLATQRLANDRIHAPDSTD